MDMKIKTVSFDLNLFVPRLSNENVVFIPVKQDKNSAGLIEVDFADVEFLSCRKQGEEPMVGEEQFARLKETERILFGASVFMGLWKDFQVKREDSVLENLYRIKQIISIDFFGDVISIPRGGEFVFWLRRFVSDNSWHWLYGWMRAECLDHRLSAVSGPKIRD